MQFFGMGQTKKAKKKSKLGAFLVKQSSAPKLTVLHLVLP